MIEIKSFLCLPDKVIKDIGEVLKRPADYFIDVSESTAVLDFVGDIDTSYVNGAILLTYYGQPIMDFRHWDLVDQLWSYILNLLGDALTNGSAETCFPDQPTQLKLEMSEHVVHFTVDKQKYVLPRDEFVGQVTAAAMQFFEQMYRYFPNQTSYTFEYHKAKQLHR